MEAQHEVGVNAAERALMVCTALTEAVQQTLHSNLTGYNLVAPSSLANSCLLTLFTGSCSLQPNPSRSPEAHTLGVGVIHLVPWNLSILFFSLLPHPALGERKGGVRKFLVGSWVVVGVSIL